jgi:hypothetical protein
MNTPARLPVLLGNDSGRDTARDVEVFVSLLPHHDGGIRLEMAEVASGLSVPPGFVRPIGVAIAGPAEMIVASLFGRSKRPKFDGVGVAFAAPTGESVFWIWPGNYEVLLWVTGANFDAKRYDGELEISGGRGHRLRGRGRARECVAPCASCDSDDRRARSDRERVCGGCRAYAADATRPGQVALHCPPDQPSGWLPPAECFAPGLVAATSTNGREFR